MPTTVRACRRLRAPAHCRKLASGHRRSNVGTGPRRSARLRRSTACRSLPRRRCASGVTVARYYDPATAQFLTRDPLAAVTRSPYGYVGGDPLNAIDPTGQFGLFDTLAAAAVGAVVGGVSSAISQYASTGSVNWGDVGIAAGAGAIAGAAFTVGCVGGCAGALAGGLTDLGTQLAHSGGDVTGVNLAEVAFSATFGYVGGKIGRTAEHALYGEAGNKLFSSGLGIAFGASDPTIRLYGPGGPYSLEACSAPTNAYV